MNGVPAFLDPTEKLKCESIATAMSSSSSPEELLKIFLTSLGDLLDVNRVAICQFTNQDEGIVLVEAISPNIQSIKNQTYPISYFGVDSLQNYPRDRPVKLSNVAQIPEIYSVHQSWHATQVKAMMSAPILFGSLTALNQIWGLAFVQQCDRIRQWQPQEAYFLSELSQVLGQCLQSWELSLRSPTFLQSSLVYGQSIDDSQDLEELIVRRVELSNDSEVIQVQPESNTDDIAVSNDFILSDDEENEILDRSRIRNSDTSINQAINLAMQKLEQKNLYSSSPYPRVFAAIDMPQDIYGVDLESTTLEDVLESCVQDPTQVQPQTKVDYLQQRVGELIESMQQKLDEIAELQKQVQELTASQQEFRRILLDLQSENLTQNIKDAVIEMYRSLTSNQ
ncbi:GAF domain-containing protein [Pseudanabaena minima]|uniref:GAF domain-containing protein n=1 Tax=Pseudanabaena minima TaxID=890415 RepID=UPI003DA97485